MGLEPDLVGVTLCGLLTLPWLGQSVQQPPGAGVGGQARPPGAKPRITTIPDCGDGRVVVSLPAPGSPPVTFSLPGPRALDLSLGGDAVQPLSPSHR